MKKYEILCLIPARGGSKGIPGKNLQVLGNKTLLGHAITIAKGSLICSKIVVSTDSPEIRKEALRYKALCPFLRPKYLSKDNTPMYPVVKHALEFMEKEFSVKFDFVLILQPTSPFRTAKDLRNALKLLVRSKAPSLVSLCRIDEPHPQKAQKIVNNRVRNFITGKKGIVSLRRQDAQAAYFLNGAIYLSRRSLLNNSLLSKDVIAYFMPLERSVNIDNMLDLEFARFLLAKRKL